MPPDGYMAPRCKSEASTVRRDNRIDSPFAKPLEELLQGCAHKRIFTEPDCHQDLDQCVMLVRLFPRDVRRLPRHDDRFDRYTARRLSRGRLNTGKHGLIRCPRSLDQHVDELLHHDSPDLAQATALQVLRKHVAVESPGHPRLSGGRLENAGDR